jgi:hypothetical protein
MHIALEQIDNGKIGRGLAIRHRRAFEHQPALSAVGVDKLVDQAGLAHPSLAHRCHKLTMSHGDLFVSLMEGFDFRVPSDKRGQSTGHRRLPASLDRTAPRVEEEVAVLGAAYPDGGVAGERIARGESLVVPIAARKWARHLAEYVLGDGERDSIELCGQERGIDALVTDDYLAFVAAIPQGLKRLQAPKITILSSAL